MDSSQGTIAVSSSTTDLALQGDGSFILAGAQGDRLYTRDGRFRVNGANELVTSSGHRVLGFGVDDESRLQQSGLVPLSIPRNKTVTDADGQAISMVSYNINEDGQVLGRYSDGSSRTLGQIRVARFANSSGLEGRADTQFSTGANTGMPIESNPGDPAAATSTGGAVELSNTDIGRNMIDLNSASIMLRASVQVLATAGEMFEALTNLGRR